MNVKELRLELKKLVIDGKGDLEIRYLLGSGELLPIHTIVDPEENYILLAEGE